MTMTLWKRLSILTEFSSNSTRCGSRSRLQFQIRDCFCTYTERKRLSTLCLCQVACLIQQRFPLNYFEHFFSQCFLYRCLSYCQRHFSLHFRGSRGYDCGYQCVCLLFFNFHFRVAIFKNAHDYGWIECMVAI